MCVAPGTNKGSADARGLDHHWDHVGVRGPRCYWAHANLRGLALPPGTMVTSGPKLLLLVMSGSTDLSQLGSVFMSVAYVATEAHKNHV